jgi:hypothetical protein
MEPSAKAAKISALCGTGLALLQWGLGLIGVAINIYLGAAVLLVTFGCFVYAFWIWERASRFHVLLRIGTILAAGFLYFAFIGNQVVSLYKSDHSPKPKKEAVEKTPTASEIAEELAKRTAGKRPATGGGSHEEPKQTAKVEPPKPLISPRVGTGPDAYKDIPDDVVGQWAIDESNKARRLVVKSDRLTAQYEQMTGKREDAERKVVMFAPDFNRYCADDIKALRNELIRRLGPAEKDDREESAYSSFVGLPAPGPLWPPPKFVGDYLPYFRWLGVKLKRRVVPRGAPVDLRFSEINIQPDSSMMKYRIGATITADRDFNGGFLVITFNEGFGKAGIDLEDSQLIWPWEGQNSYPELASALADRRSIAYQIWTTPIKAGEAIHMEASSINPIHVGSVRHLDE